MQAMILAAGRGKRMCSLTDHTPKPLLTVADKPLIEYTVEALVQAGFKEIIINLAYLGEQIAAYLGDGSRYQAQISYSHEGDAGLETAGGIKKALPLLGNAPFLVVNADVFCDFTFASLLHIKVDLAHLILVNNPAHHLKGDFAIGKQALLSHSQHPKYTFSGIGIYHPDLFKDIKPGKAALGALLKMAMQNQHITGELYAGFWMDIGTPERLAELNALIIL